MLGELALVSPAVVVFVLVSSQTSINSYHRYVLPALPFAFVWMSQLAESKNRRVRSVVPLLVIWSTLSSLAVFPHFGSHFSVLAGGPYGGPKHLVDSNVGWGQDLIFLKEWLDAHPEARPLGLAYYGTIDPRDVGIEFFEAPKGGNCRRSVADCPGSADAIGPLPGWYAIDVSFVHGLRKSLPDGRGGWNPYRGPHVLLEV